MQQQFSYLDNLVYFVFLKQRLDMAIQRGNAAAVMSTLAEGNALQD
jgi:hypothetical protein